MNPQVCSSVTWRSEVSHTLSCRYFVTSLRVPVVNSIRISLGEMVAYLPIPGGHIKLAERFVCAVSVPDKHINLTDVPGRPCLLVYDGVCTHGSTSLLLADFLRDGIIGITGSSSFPQSCLLRRY